MKASLMVGALAAMAGAVAWPAYADKAKAEPPPVSAMFLKLPPQPDSAQPSGPGPRFAFGPETPSTSDLSDAVGQFSQFAFELKQPIVVTSKDGKAQWLASDVDVWMPLTSEADDVPNRKPDGYFHTTALIDGAPKWAWTFWHAGWTGFRKQPRPKWATKLPAVADQIESGAEPVVAQVKTALADPAALAAAFDDRDTAVLFGSEAKERYVGTKAVRATLAKWKLSFTVHDGVRAGLTGSKTVAWVAMNVDARSAKTPKAKAAPYRASAVLEKIDGAWKLVVLQFSSAPKIEE